MSFIPYSQQYLVAWDDILYSGTLSASTEADDGPVENVADGFTSDYWQATEADGSPYIQVDTGTAATADYFAIHGHNVFSIGGSVTLQGSDNASSWTTVSGPHVPSSDGANLWTFDAVSYRYYRLAFTGTAPFVSVAQIGERMVLPQGVFVGYEPEPYNKKNEIQNQKSENGQLLGRSLIRTGIEGEIRQAYVTQSWVRNVWQPFADYAMLRPFFVAWRYIDYPEEVAYCWAVSDPVVKQGANLYMAVSLKFSGQL